MNECVERWKSNRPLSSGEINGMRTAVIVRCLCAILILLFVGFCLCGCQTAWGQARGVFPASEDTPTFEGVTIVVVVKELTSFAPDLRKKAAQDADRVLADLVERKLEGRVRTRLIAEVAEPYVFRQFEAASMISANPVMVHVFVPAANRNLVASMIVRKMQDVAQSHFLEELQDYQLVITYQRTMPERYQVGVMAAELRERPPSLSDPTSAPMPVPPAPTSDTPGPDKDRDGLLWVMVSAWLTERSKLAQKCLACMQWVKFRFS